MKLIEADQRHGEAFQRNSLKRVEATERHQRHGEADIFEISLTRVIRFEKASNETKIVLTYCRRLKMHISRFKTKFHFVVHHSASPKIEPSLSASS